MASEADIQAQSHFLSYSRQDERFALRLANDLRARGIGIWVDQVDIRPSEHWDRAIERAVRNCRGIVVVLSPRSAASDNVADEISYALDSGKSVLPVLIEACTLPLRITRMQVIDATRNYERALQLCVDELTRHIDAPSPTAPPAPAPSPVLLDPKVIAVAKERVAMILGPIAGVLVDRAAARASSTGDLYRQLAEHIESDAEREHFLVHASAAPAAATISPGSRKTSLEERRASSIPAEELDRLSRLFTRYVGPIARKLVERESRCAASQQELCGTLSLLISNQKERAEFLRESKKH